MSILTFKVMSGDYLDDNVILSFTKKRIPALLHYISAFIHLTRYKRVEEDREYA